MKKLYLLCTLCLLAVKGPWLHAQLIDAGPDVSVCAGPVQLTATIDSVYLGGAIPPIPVTLTDDQFSGVVNIGFPFTFYGNTYTQCVISSNNYITFDLSVAGGYCPWTIVNPCPSPNPSGGTPASPLNAVMGPWQDILPPAGGQISYQTIGTAPNRMFVVEYCNIPMFSCTGLFFSSQIILFEGSNRIETHIINKPLCPTWNTGQAIHGLHNATGTIAHIVPGRNAATQWTTANEGYEFVPTGAATYAINPVPFQPVLLGSPTPPLVLWYIMGNPTPIDTGLTISVNPSVTTTYIVRIVGNACGGLSDEDTVTVFIGAPDPAIVGVDSICPGDSVLLSTSHPFTNYLWSTGDTTATIYATAGSYTVYVIGTLGCDSTSVPFVVTQVPAPNPTITGNLQFCTGGSTTLDAGAGYTTYQWNNGGGSNQTANVLIPGTWSVQVSFGGCLGYDTVTVVENPNPSPQVIGYSLVCQGDSVPLSLSGTYTNYSWSTTETTPVIWVGAGSYTVAVTDTNGCSGTSLPFVVGVSNPAVTISGVPEFCQGDSTQLSANPVANFIAFNWSTGATASSAYVGASGWVTLSAIDTAGCLAVDSIQITANPLPEPNFQTGPVCDGDMVNFADASVISQGGINSYDWNLGDGNTASGQNINHTYAGPGNYTVSLLLTSDKGCVDSITGNVTVYANPTANYIAMPGCFQQVFFVDQSAPPGSIAAWHWGFGDDSTAAQTDSSVALMHHYITAGQYTTYLVVTDTNSCTDSLAVDIIVDEGVQLPDSLPDILVLTSTVGNNTYDFEVFAPGFNQCISYTFSVFNRWGLKVFETVNNVTAPDLNCSDCFRGQSNTGSFLTPGVYFYVLEGSEQVSYNGMITIVE